MLRAACLRLLRAVAPELARVKLRRARAFAHPPLPSAARLPALFLRAFRISLLRFPITRAGVFSLAVTTCLRTRLGVCLVGQNLALWNAALFRLAISRRL